MNAAPSRTEALAELTRIRAELAECTSTRRAKILDGRIGYLRWTLGLVDGDRLPSK